MRKRLKKKLRSCTLCKPHKMGWDNRWKPKQASLLADAEKEMDRAKKSPCDTQENSVGAERKRC